MPIICMASLSCDVRSVILGLYRRLNFLKGLGVAKEETMQKKSSSIMASLVGVIISIFSASTASSMDYLNTVVTDGQQDFSEGVLEGYFLQAGGVNLCKNPYVIGKYISCSPALKIAGLIYSAPSKKVWVKTNGQLAGMDVIGAQGSVLCTGPVSSNMFRGPDSYLYCP